MPINRNMEPNVVHRPSVPDLLKAAVVLFVLLPCTAIYKTTRWLLSPKLNREPLKEVLGRPLFIGLAPYFPVSILQYVGGKVGKGSDLLKSKRYARQNGHVFKRVQKLDFAGYWICQGLEEDPVALLDADIVILYIHGGAYIFGWPAMDGPQMLLMAEIAAQEGLSVACFALEYSHAPAACLPVQVIQARAAYEWLVKDQGVPASKISLMGESAGGHLALAFLMDLHLRPSTSVFTKDSSKEASTLSKPGSAFLLSPWVDLFNSNPKTKMTNDFDRAFKNMLVMCAGMVLRTTPDQYRALVENFAVTVKERGSWKDILPKNTWVSGGSEERIFIEDIRDLVAQAQKDGAKIVLEVHEGGDHAWQNREAWPVKKNFLASEPGVNDDGLMPGYRVVAKELVRVHRESVSIQ